MNSIHDLGGLDGLTIPERDQGRILKTEWEQQVWGLAIAGWAKAIPGYRPFSRANIEQIPPAQYLKMPYYAKWLYVIEEAMLRSGVVTEEELENPDGDVRSTGAVEQPLRRQPLNRTIGRGKVRDFRKRAAKRRSAAPWTLFTDHSGHGAAHQKQGSGQ